MSMIWCGIDWAERDHDVALVDDEGNLVAKRRIGDDAAGFTMLLELLAEHGATSDGQQATPIAIETASGLLPAALLASGFTVYAINPLAVSRYRDRYAVSRAKSNAGDAFVLANVLRTDRNAHRPVPNDSELVRAIRVLARAQQDAVWDRQQAQNKLRSLLREYYPSALTTFTDLAAPAAREALLLSPTPAHAARLRAIDVARPLYVRVGGRCGIDAVAESVGDRGQTAVTGPQLGSRGQPGRGEQLRVDVSDTEPVQLLVGDEAGQFAVGGHLCLREVAQQC